MPYMRFPIIRKTGGSPEGAKFSIKRDIDRLFGERPEIDAVLSPAPIILCF